jgi:acyl-CoA thioester hydrolase
MREFIWPVRVYYEDTDSGGVVYYANYLKFMERARSEWLRNLGFEQDRLIEEEGVIFVVRRVELDFRAPARFNDVLQISVRLKEIKRASMTFLQEIKEEKSGRLLCGGNVQIASVAADKFRPCAIPERLTREITVDAE